MLVDSIQPETAFYMWRIPEDMQDKRCAIRLRYNISTLDYPSDSYAYLNANPYVASRCRCRHC